MTTMCSSQEAGLVALQVLESIRASHPGLIADNMPDGWGMNRLRSALRMDVSSSYVAPYYVFIDHEKSISDHPTLEEARSAGQKACDSEILPCTFSIQDAEGKHVEDLIRSDGASLSDQMAKFNATLGSRIA